MKIVNTLRGDLIVSETPLPILSIGCADGSVETVRFDMDHVPEMLKILNFHTEQVGDPFDKKAILQRQTAFIKFRETLGAPRLDELCDVDKIVPVRFKRDGENLVFEYAANTGHQSELLFDFVATQALAAELEEFLQVAANVHSSNGRAPN